MRSFCHIPSQMSVERCPSGPHLGTSTTEDYCLTVPRLEVQDQGVGKVGLPTLVNLETSPLGLHTAVSLHGLPTVHLNLLFFLIFTFIYLFYFFGSART